MITIFSFTINVLTTITINVLTTIFVHALRAIGSLRIRSQKRCAQKIGDVPFLKPSIGTLAAALVFSLLTSTAAQARDFDAGVLDGPLLTPGPGLSIQGIGKQEAKRQQQAQKKEIKKEEKRLKKLSAKALEKEAKKGDRLAQLVLADHFAEEALAWTALPSVANQAMGDAVRWYSLAAKRGYPGAQSIDGAVSALPLRIVRAKK